MHHSATAAAASGDEIVRSYDLTLDARATGLMRVTEVLDYQFPAGQRRHGIYRDVPRAGRVENVRARSLTGAPDQVSVSRGRRARIRVGDPDRLVTGRHRYVLEYDVPSLATNRDQGQRLTWNVTGHWPVPLENVRITLAGPVPPSRVRCLGTGEGPATCPEPALLQGRVTTTVGRLAPGSGVLIVADYPPGTFPEAGSVASSWPFDGDDLALGAGTFLVVLVATVGWLRRRTGDHPAVGAPPGLVPDSLEPGAAALVLDERARSRAIAATISSLVVRGFLVVRRSGPGDADWDLQAVEPETAGELSSAQERLMRALFMRNGWVPVRGLAAHSGHLAGLRAVVRMLEDAGWYRMTTQQVRSVWLWTGAVQALGGFVGAFLLAAFTGLGFLGVGVSGSGLVVLVLAARVRGARSSYGAAVHDEVCGYRARLAAVDENRDERPDPPAPLHEEHVPWAVAFGLVAAPSHALPRSVVLTVRAVESELAKPLATGIATGRPSGGHVTSGYTNSYGLSALGRGGGSWGGGSGGGGSW